MYFATWKRGGAEEMESVHSSKPRAPEADLGEKIVRP